MTLTFGDFARYQPDISGLLTGLDGAILKLYDPADFPNGDIRHTWTANAYDAAAEYQKKHPDFVIGFYAADSTPTWAAAKHVITQIIGVDPNAHPFAFDLREFGFTKDYVKGQVAAAHADGQVKVGHYWRLTEDVKEDWRWKAHYLSDPPDEPWLLWQYTSTPFDHSKTHDGVTLAQFLAATTDASPPPPPPGGDDLTPDQEAQLKQAADAGYIAQREALHHGIDISAGKPWRDDLAKVRASADRKALGVADGKPTPVPPTVP